MGDFFTAIQKYFCCCIDVADEELLTNQTQTGNQSRLPPTDFTAIVGVSGRNPPAPVTTATDLAVSSSPDL
ncbi:hypothetical protein L2E82_30896 [Cichorium intybus]|uniref:Uncharacterized protein n=1 Tax=Cichorium intybus TaxID=13427 RepID=A0ACB9D1M1_CICIN|nr:hypothetical protein L2E82_30896 [Cichorium intybus]